jgi:hypothetical protein
MKYPKEQFLLPFRVDLIREERRRLVEIPDRSTAEYDLEKLTRRAKIHDAKITKHGKTYTLIYTTRTPYSEDFWTPNPSNPSGHPWAAVKPYRDRKTKRVKRT